MVLESGKFALYPWDRNPEMEAIIKDRWKGTTRCIPFIGQFTDTFFEKRDPNLSYVIIARSF